MKIRIKKTHIPFFILLVFGALIFFMGCMNHYFFRSYIYDYGNYNFAFWDYSHFRISSLPTSSGNFLQDHYSFLLMFLVPVYWLLNWLTGTYTLIIIQNALILIAAWYTYKLIKLKTDNLWLGAGVLVYYFVLLGRYTSFSTEVNLAIMTACFIPVFLYYFKLKKYLTSFVILILSLLSRENIPIWFIFIFILLIIQHRKEKKAVIFSLFGIALSLLYFILLFKVLIPAIETDEKQFTLFNYAALGASPGEALSFIIQNPIETIKMFFINHLDNTEYDGIKAEFYLVYLISGGIVLLLRPQYLIWFIPIVAQKVLNDEPVRWGIESYYAIEVVTLLPLSVFLALASLKSRKLKIGLTIAVCAATISMTGYKLDKSNRLIHYLVRSDKEKFYCKEFYHTNYNLSDTRKLLKLIPSQAKISASEYLLPHLAQRQFAYFFPAVHDAEYVIFSVFADHYNHSYMENERERNKYFTNPDWEIIGKEFPVFLFKKKDTPDLILSQKPKIVFKTDTLYCNFEIIDTISNQVLFDNGIFADLPDRLNSDNSRSGKHSLLLMHDNSFGKSIQFNDINNLSYITSSVWYYGKDNNAIIVAQFGNRLYFHTKTAIESDDSDWKKLELSFWIPQKGDNTDFSFYLWNGNKEDSVLFDDIQIIRRFK